MKKVNSILWGLVLIAVGVLLALNVLGYAEGIFFEGWWTLFLIIPSAIGIVTDKDKTAAFIGLSLGVLLLLCCQDVLEFSLILKLFIPFVIIVIGLRVLLGSMWKVKTDKIMDQAVVDGAHIHNVNALFAGEEINMNGQEFSGANLSAIFGGIDYDLRGAVITKDCVIKVKSIFGGIDIIMPENVSVKVSSTSLFGGIGNKKHGGIKEKTATVYVEGLCLFGGVEIK